MGDTPARYLAVEESPPTPQQHGAAGNGITDDTQALAAFAAAGYSSAFIPPGVYTTKAQINSLAGSSFEFSPAATIKATATIAGAIWQTPVSTAIKNRHFIGGVFDCNDAADYGLNFRWFEHLTLERVRVRNPKSHAVLLHDPAAGSTSFEAIVDGIHVDRGDVSAPGSVPASSIGAWLRATDSELSRVIVQGQDVGMRVDTEANHLTDCHVWGYAGALPSQCFYDNSYRNVWIGCTADTPSQYGWYNTGRLTCYIGCRVYINGYGPDNAVTGIHHTDANPAFTSLGVMFAGKDASHRLAADFAGAGGATGATILGTDSTNVVNRQAPFANQFDIVRMTTALTIHSVSATRGLAVRNATGANTTFAVDSTSATKRVLIGSGAQVAGFSDELASETWRIDSSKGTMRPMAWSTAQRNGLSSLSAGDTVYDSTLKKLVTWDGTAWRDQAGATV